MEVGISFKAIIENLEANGHSFFTREYFPYCWAGQEDEEDNEDIDEDTNEDMDTN